MPCLNVLLIFHKFPNKVQHSIQELFIIDYGFKMGVEDLHHFGKGNFDIITKDLAHVNITRNALMVSEEFNQI